MLAFAIVRWVGAVPARVRFRLWMGWKPRIPHKVYPKINECPASLALWAGRTGSKAAPLASVSEHTCIDMLECVVTCTVFIHDIIPLS